MSLANVSTMPLRMTDNGSTKHASLDSRRAPAHEPAVGVSSRDVLLLVREIQRLQDENEALRGSAEIWIRMYEGQVQRAKSAAAGCTCGGSHHADAPRRNEDHER